MSEQLKRNAKDNVFKDLLRKRNNLVKFYYGLTGKEINSENIVYDTIATSIVKGHEEDVAFQIGSTYIILIEAQSTWQNKEIIRFAYYMFTLFINYMEEHKELFETNKEITVPIVEAYIIYTGSDDLPEMVSLAKNFPNQKDSMINAEMKVLTEKNATGMVKEYIEFSKLETEYYRDNKREKKDVLELIDFCINNNILKDYLLNHRREVTNLVENFFTEERRIQNLINEAKLEEREKLKYEFQKKEAELDAERQAKEAKTILNLYKQDFSKEKIAEITGNNPDFVSKILKEHSN